MCADKLAKQKEFLRPHLESIVVNQEVGIPTLKYLAIDCAEYEAKLAKYRQLIDYEIEGWTLPTKTDLMTVINGLDGLTSAMMNDMVEAWMNIGQIQVQEEYLKLFYEVDQKRMDYLAKWQKSFNRKKAVGFDTPRK